MNLPPTDDSAINSPPAPRPTPEPAPMAPEPTPIISRDRAEDALGRSTFIRGASAIGLVAVGVLIGVGLAPESPSQSNDRIAQLEAQLDQARYRIAELTRSPGATKVSGTGGALSDADRKRHAEHGKRYVRELRKGKAQSAAELVAWFLTRWDDLLDSALPGDRTGRRAELLARLVGGMGRNLHPGDYVPWQAEFLSGNWLAELHRDSDADGLPRKRTGANTNDHFTDTSVCTVAMAMNQTTSNAKVLVMPAMRCDSPKAKLSVFLPGKTLDDALDELVRALGREGFVVREKKDRGTRLVLVGPPAG